VPKYPEIKATLKGRLLGGAYREGEPMPSEADLAREFAVSRMTTRRAVDELEREGYVRRVQGAGSYPTGRRFRQGVFRVAPLEELAGTGRRSPASCRQASSRPHPARPRPLG
jgi:DNA-binding GntR family transcriptional regulator